MLENRICSFFFLKTKTHVIFSFFICFKFTRFCVLIPIQVQNLVKHAASPPTESCPAPSALHSPPVCAAPESPLTSADLPPNKAPSSLPADLAPCERLLDFSMGGSPHALGLPVSAPPQFHWVFITKTDQNVHNIVALL